ncbi:MAG: TadE/TadG family type IV pilus assembly protein [Devosiaceae bacterium]
MRAFHADTRGGVAILFGLAAIPMVGVAGASLDYSRAADIRSGYQNAADAAALAAATSSLPNLEARQDYARAVFDANAPDTGHTVSHFSLLEVDLGYEVQAGGGVDTTLLGVIGITDIDVGVSSIAAAGSDPLEITFVIDATRSMTFGNRWQIAHSSLESVLNALDNAIEDNNDLTVTAIPMGDRINVGTARFDWVEGFEGDDVEDENAGNNGRRGHWNDEEREGDGDNGRRGHRDRDGTETDDRLPLAQWQGCVEPREEDDPDNPYLLTNATPAELYFAPLDHRSAGGIHEERWYHCPQPIVGPTDQMSTIIHEMRQLQAAGTGRFDTGMAWAWRSLSPSWSGEWGQANYPAPTGDARKVAVFISDGNSTMERTEFDGVQEWGHNNSGAAMFDNLLAVCEDMKADGITVYMFYIEGNPYADEYFRDCATSAAHYFDVTTNDDMMSAFDSLGASLMEARLVR